ncbi:hypothetical protein GYMLUDRAFT_848643 [Collybiopsis luxurians FD-317 M1]|nr:hypothetical protein GYMLUDRAFT_848643 [Collybiopsis luxurians FD-317 M1]
MMKPWIYDYVLQVAESRGAGIYSAILYGPVYPIKITIFLSSSVLKQWLRLRVSTALHSIEKKPP